MLRMTSPSGKGEVEALNRRSFISATNIYFDVITVRISNMYTSCWDQMTYMIEKQANKIIITKLSHLKRLGKSQHFLWQKEISGATLKFML